MNRDDIFDLYLQLREETKEKWNRVLPVGELLTDRWEKAKSLQFGDGASIYDSAIVMGDVTAGEGTWIGPDTILDGTGGRLDIGKGCDISMGVQIYTHDTVKRCVSGGKYPVEKAGVCIGDHCYIAPMSTIAKGVTIGKGSIVAAHSFVKDSFEEYSIVAGIPAKKIGRVHLTEDNVELEYFK